MMISDSAQSFIRQTVRHYISNIQDIIVLNLLLEDFKSSILQPDEILKIHSFELNFSESKILSEKNYFRI